MLVEESYTYFLEIGDLQNLEHMVVFPEINKFDFNHSLLKVSFHFLLETQ